MAFGDRGYSERFQKERSRILTEYDAEQRRIARDEEERLNIEAIKAQKQTVKLKAGETVHDLLQKGYGMKAKKIMAQDFFKETKFGTGDNAINMFSSGGGGPDIPFADVLGYETPSINPTVYERLGKTAYKGSEASKMTSQAYQKLGKAFVEEGGAPKVAEAGAKLTEEMGSFAKLGEWLGPAGAGLTMVGGINTLASGDATEADDVIAAGSQVVGGGMVAGGAAFTALTGTAVANAWNPIGWTLGIGGSLYGAAKGLGIF